jgi:hypothetical protein
MPSQYSLDDIENLLHSFGLTNQPSATKDSGRIVYFQRIFSTNHITRFVLNDHKMYQKQNVQKALAHRVGFLFENHLGKMAIVLNYEPLQLASTTQSLWTHDGLAQTGQILSASGFCFAKGQKYLQQLLSTIAKPAACYPLRVEDDIIFFETVRVALCEGLGTYLRLRSRLTMDNRPNILASHEVKAIKRFKHILQEVAPNVRQEILTTLGILVKYHLLQQAQTQVEKLPTAEQRFAFAQQLQKKIFSRSYVNFTALEEYLSATGFLPALTFLQLYKTSGETALRQWLSKEKEKRQETLENWFDRLASDLPTPTCRGELGNLLQSLMSNNYITFLSHLFGFLFDQCTAWPILTALQKLRPLACLFGAGLGAAIIYSTEFSETLYISGITFLYALLAPALQPEHMNLAEARITHDRWLTQQIKHSLPILFTAFIRSMVYLESAYFLESIVASIMRMTLDGLFSLMIIGIPVHSELEKNIHLFLFTRLALLAFSDINDRHVKHAVISEKFSSIHTMQANFSLWGWWFFNACFRLTDRNATHLRILDCYANNETLNWDANLSADIRESQACVLQTEFTLT